jgi:cytochrome-b5 reductase
VSDYNHNTKKYTFAFPDKEAISGGGITHLLMIKAATEGAVVDDAGKEVARPYTPISSPDTVGKIDFLIKKYDVRLSFPFEV